MILDLGNQILDAYKPWLLPRDDFHYPARGISATDWKELLNKAQKGDPESEWNVADCYYGGCVDGMGKSIVRRNPAKAVYWFRRSAEHGNTSAYNNLGCMLSDGTGVEKYIKEALYWLKKAVKAGDVYAAGNIAIVYRENGSLRRAVHWFLKCTVLGDDSAYLDLGIHLYWGRGVKKDCRAAVEHFRAIIKSENVCEADRDDAFFYLGVAHLEGRGCKQSISMAKRLFRRANMDDDHPAAQKALEMVMALSQSSTNAPE